MARCSTAIEQATIFRNKDGALGIVYRIVECAVEVVPHNSRFWASAEPFGVMIPLKCSGNEVERNCCEVGCRVAPAGIAPVNHSQQPALSHIMFHSCRSL